MEKEKEMRVIVLFIIILFFSCGIEAPKPQGLDYYKFAQNKYNCPEDSLNPITPAKDSLGEFLFSSPKISLTGKHTCASCHVPNNNFQSPDNSIIGGAGEGFVLVNGKYEKDLGFEGKVDSMTWVRSGHANVAYHRLAGQSTRFGGTTNEIRRQDIIRHFNLHTVPKEVLDKLFKCESTLFQAFIALSGHKLFSVNRLWDEPEIIARIEKVFNTDIITPSEYAQYIAQSKTDSTIIVPKVTDSYELAFMVACTFDVFQRTKSLRNQTKWQKYLNGYVLLDTTELKGLNLMLANCIDCHSEPDFSGNIAESFFPNDPTKPDAVNDITFVENASIIYRKVREIVPDYNSYGPRGQFPNHKEYMSIKFDSLHANGYTRLFTPEEKFAINEFIKTL